MPKPADQSPISKSGERIAKVMARAGLASRRQAEAWIAQGRVAVNGHVISSPALNVTGKDHITIDGAPLPIRARTRLFLYNKPRGLVTTHSDPEGRRTVFETLPKALPRLISVGRLDINTEGLLLLTNDGGLARVLELPATSWLRRYRVRALGRVTQKELDSLRKGITIAGIHYGPIEATLDRDQSANVWLTFVIGEGKNREVRKVLETLGLKVSRLIRVSYGPFELGALEEGEVKEVETQDLVAVLGSGLAAQAQADFDAPLEYEKSPKPPSRRLAQRGAGRSGSPRTRSSGSPRNGKVGEEREEKRPMQTLRGHSSSKKERDKKKKRRRPDRAGGPRPKYPRPRA